MIIRLDRRLICRRQYQYHSTRPLIRRQQRLHFRRPPFAKIAEDGDVTICSATNILSDHQGPNSRLVVLNPVHSTLSTPLNPDSVVACKDTFVPVLVSPNPSSPATATATATKPSSGALNFIHLEQPQTHPSGTPITNLTTSSFFPSSTTSMSTDNAPSSQPPPPPPPQQPTSLVTPTHLTTPSIKAPYTYIDTILSLKFLLQTLSSAYDSYLSIRKNIHTPFIYVDLEGNDLCRFGTVSICQVHVPTIKMTFVVDVLVLGSEAFTTILDVPSFSTPEEEELHDDDDPMPNFQPDPDPDPILPTYPFPTPTSLQSILESPNIVKGFFDVRNDSDALYNIYNISMSNVSDIQILEIATRKGRKRLLNGLARAIQRDGGLEKEALNGWLAVKEVGKKYFKASEGKSGGGGGAEERENRGETSRKRIEEGDGGTEKKVVVMTGTERPGTLEQPTDTAAAAAATTTSEDDATDLQVGSTKVFDTRPLPTDLLEYSINDVIHLPRLWAIYDARLNTKWRAKTENEAVWRLQLAKQDVYYGKGGHMALSPF